ncbi:MAG TPA: 4Fe-4S binding protein [Dehalococcoidia bacterium]|nr:4Fe-4S binding protein [Dehalococcoidia bacterium]
MAAPAYIISADCVSCGICEDRCPRAAIVAAHRRFLIRQRACSGCGFCVGYCPVRAIVRQA